MNFEKVKEKIQTFLFTSHTNIMITIIVSFFTTSNLDLFFVSLKTFSCIGVSQFLLFDYGSNYIEIYTVTHSIYQHIIL
jgi:hypothetical protein